MRSLWPITLLSFRQIRQIQEKLEAAAVVIFFEGGENEVAIDRLQGLCDVTTLCEPWERWRQHYWSCAGPRAILVYRLPWTWKCSKLLMKCIHAGLHLTATVLVVVALVAVFDFHNAKNIPNMYSLHSWVGLTVVILFVLQLVVSIFVYLLPFTSVSLRAAFMPIHVYSGLLLFGGIIATSLMGITEKLIFSLKDPPYSKLPPHGVFVNTLGLMIAVFGGLIIWITTRSGWKRPPEHVLKDQHPFGSPADDASTTDYGKGKSDEDLNSEARKRNLKLDEAGQRSTM
ncbi:plasma membrane ascorbate-dependent reductase CYBRD1 isoform X1 [Dendrobates tinctorius]|uniref:plasma membrane ascorbate-dependent reductase CYBRD1 isoform X1 n=1 Tax=Dendrobates tinctorius TaxID=92724 RepID=UPI003CC9740B